MLDREQLETFATVAEEQSFEKAAVKLNITRGAVSQRLKALEESVAAVLLVREKPVLPTPAGEILLRHVQAMRLFESAALNELNPTPRHHEPVALAIAVNADSLATWFPLVLHRILLNRQMAIEVISDDQDHTAARLVRGEVIGCISTDARPAVSFLAKPLGAMTYRCCAAPAYAAEHFRDGLTVQGVLSTTAVLFNRKDALHDDFLRRVFGFSIDRYARHYLPSPAALLNAIVIGGGYGLVPSAQCESLIRDGQLIDLAPEHAVDVALHWHHWMLEPPLAQDITALIVEVAHGQLKQAPMTDTAVFGRQSALGSDGDGSGNGYRDGDREPLPDQVVATRPDVNSPVDRETRSASPRSTPDQDST